MKHQNATAGKAKEERFRRRSGSAASQADSLTKQKKSDSAAEAALPLRRRIA
ncbi:MAG: hypothetical protein FWD35_03205 [Oscillospiraceae bacterium]|nr:hypothetical protein [Oscillospiraceae bacterium]